MISIANVNRQQENESNGNTKSYHLEAKKQNNNTKIISTVATYEAPTPTRTRTRGHL